ncbi:MAG TPA: hypothetical protein VGA73_03125 [Candidatus Binatia bacterium]
MKPWPALLLLAISLVGCSTARTEITKKNNRIEAASYSFVIAADQGWYMQRDEKGERITLTKQAGPIVWQIMFYKNILLADQLAAASAEAVADDFRKLEVQVMMEEGVKKGKYQLRDIKMGEEIVGDRAFYTLEHVALSPSLMQRASMYLYFPQAKNNRYFFVAHYFETTAPGVAAKSLKDEFLSALASLTVK